MRDENSHPQTKTLRRAAFVGSVLGAAGLLLAILMRGRTTTAVTRAPALALPAAPSAVAERPAQSQPLPRPDVRFAVGWLSSTLTLAACALLATSAFFYRTHDQLATLSSAVGFTLLGGGALGLAILLGRPAIPLLRPAHTRDGSPVNRRRTLLLLLPGTMLLALLAVINVSGTAEADTFWRVPVDLQMALLAGGAALVIAGMGGARMDELAPARPRGAAWALLAITLLALAVRLWNLENAVHIFMDELNFVEAINSIRAGENIKLLHPFGGLTAFPWVFPYLQKLSADVLGSTLTGIRMPSVFFGTLTIPALYLLARTLFDRRTALLAAFLLALFPPHIHYSRLGMNNIADPFFGTLALAFVARGLKANRRLDYALAGGALGLTQYFYEGGRLLFPALVIGWLLVSGLVWRLRAHWRNWLVMTLTAVMIAAPFYYTQWVMGFSAAPRLADMGHRQEYIAGLLMTPDTGWVGKYFEFSLRPALLHYVYTPDGSAFFYGGETALILPHFVPLFLLGGFWALWRLRAAGALLILWPLLAALGNSLLQQPDWSARFVVAFPALPLAIAVGLRYTWLLLVRRTGPEQGISPRARAAGLALSLGVMALAGAQLPYYFGPHLALYNEQVRPNLDFHDVMFRARALPPGTEVYMISDADIWWPQVSGMMRFWNLEVAVNFWRPDENLPLQLLTLRSRPNVNRAFFVRPGDSTTLRLLRAQFDLNFPELSPYNVPADKQYVLYFAPARDAAQGREAAKP